MIFSFMDSIFDFFEIFCVCASETTTFSSDFINHFVVSCDANLVLITSDCCEGPPANAFLDCFDFSMGLYVGQKGQA